MFLVSMSATSFGGSGRAAFSLIGRTLSVLQPESAKAAPSAAEAQKRANQWASDQTQTPPQAAAVTGGPRADLQNR